jgi:hypothetical protein
MIPQAWQQLDMSESDTIEREEQSDSAPTLVRAVSNVAFTEALPKAHMLSYLMRTESDASAVDAYEALTGYTANLDGLNESAIPERDEPKHIIFLKTKPRQSVFTSLQKWEGVVLEVWEDAFLARLVDLTRPGPDEEAEFPLDEISEEDRPLVRPGAIFYWNIGYHDSSSGQRTRASIIRFRRLPAWRREEIEAARLEAERIRESIGWK